MAAAPGGDPEATDQPAAVQPALPDEAAAGEPVAVTATAPDVADGGPPEMGVVRPGPTSGVAPVVQGDWLASVCPYLTSADGAYRSAAPDEGHRCTAQDPAASLPLAFQERFCLTDRHPRCEMYKFAQETDSSGGIPVAKVPPTDPPTPKTRRAGGGGGGNRPFLATLAGIAGLVVVVLLVLVFMGSCAGDGDSGADPDLVPDEQATEAPASTPRPTPAPETEETPPPDATPDESAGETIRILYEIQPEEALLRISETFGISRNRIRRENPELEDLGPADLPGTIIELPILGDLTLAEVQALPGYQGTVSELESAADGA
jgi:hypothetical protein